MSSCQLLEGQQYLDNGASYVLGGDATEELRNYVETQCADDASCLVPILDGLFGDEVGDTDAGGLDLAQLLSTAAGAGQLDSVFLAAIPGDCIEVAKAGGVQLLASSDPLCSAGVGLGSGATCTSTLHPDGEEAAVAWRTWPAELAVTVERSVNGGTFASIYSAVASDVEYNDPAVPSGSIAYRVVSGNIVADCTDTPYVEGIDVAALGLDIDANGRIIGQDAGLLPARVANYASNYSPVDSTIAEDVCTAGSLTVKVVEANWGVRHYTKVTIPADSTFIFDIVNRKGTPGASGNWIGQYRLHDVLSDGTIGGIVAENGGTGPGYAWQLEEVTPDYELYTNTGPTKEFFFSYTLDQSFSIYSADNASISAVNLRFVDPDDDHLIGRTCDIEDIIWCEESTPNSYFSTERVVVDGITYEPGCYEWDTCVRTIGGLLGSLQEWSCENNDFLEDLLLLGVGFIVIGGTLVLLGGAGVIAAGERAATTIGWDMALGAALLIAGTTVSVYTSSQNFDVLVLPDLRDFIPDVPSQAEATAALASVLADLFDGTDPLEYEFDTGNFVETGTSVVSLIEARSNYENYFDPDWSPEQTAAARQVFRYAMTACIAAMATTPLASIVQKVLDGGVSVNDFISPVTFTDVNGLPRHLCEFVPIYAPAGRNHGSIAPHAQATFHIREVLFEEPYPYGMSPHSGTQPELPRIEWMFLRRQKPAPANKRWYKSSPYNCDASTPEACDEWPWNMTYEGGKPAANETQPHLRILDGGHNSNSGSDVRAFGNRCGVQDSDIFVVAPVPIPAVAIEWPLPGSPPLPLELVPSQWLCSETIPS